MEPIVLDGIPACRPLPCNGNDFYDIRESRGYYSVDGDGRMARNECGSCFPMKFSCPFFDGPVISKNGSFYRVLDSRLSEKQIYFCTIPGDEKSPGPHSQPMDMKKILFLAWALLAMVEAGAANRQLSEKSTTMSKLANDTRVFAIDPAIDVQGVRFKNRFGIELAGHLYLPKNFDSSKCMPRRWRAGAS